jgi:hypothetical protein
VKYPDLPFAMRPLPHIEELPGPKPPENILAMITLTVIKITESKKGAILTAI